ncbi:MAG: PEP-CTERM sorting domain-containing protein [Nitrospiraceae bacterium]|nr:MAG: PEP-CTERM sorting domain-containing protein [Nitrospiraceae bacterium]
MNERGHRLHFILGTWVTLFAYTLGKEVRAGDVPVVPEPISSILFVTGGTLFSRKKVIKKEVGSPPITEPT